MAHLAWNIITHLHCEFDHMEITILHYWSSVGQTSSSALRADGGTAMARRGFPSPGTTHEDSVMQRLSAVAAIATLAFALPALAQQKPPSMQVTPPPGAVRAPPPGLPVTPQAGPTTGPMVGRGVDAATVAGGGLRAGLPVTDTAGAAIGSIARVIRTPDGATTYAVTMDGRTVNLPGSALTLSVGGDHAVSAMTRAQIAAQVSPP